MSHAAIHADTPLEDYVCLSLYAASRAVTGLYRELLADLGLTYPQYLVMRLLWQRGARRGQGDRCRCSSSTTERCRLCSSGWSGAGIVHRTRRPDDERSVEIAPTEAGEALRAKAADVPRKLSCALGLDDDAAAELRATLRHLTASVHDAASHKAA